MVTVNHEYKKSNKKNICLVPGKIPSKIFSRTGGPISMKLGIKHLGLQPIIVCSNYDPGVTLTYFMARSNLVT